MIKISFTRSERCDVVDLITTASATQDGKYNFFVEALVPINQRFRAWTNKPAQERSCLLMLRQRGANADL